MLVFTVDEHFAMQLAVTLYSALVNLSPKSGALIYILDCGLTEKSRHRLERVAETSGARARLEWIAVDTEYLRGLNVELHERFSLSVLARLFIAEMLSEDIDKAIYLDSDLIAEADLTGLWKTDLGDSTVLAMREWDISCPMRGVAQWQELGLPPEAPYFNSGVMVMNLGRWREENVGQKVLAHLSRNKGQLNLHGNQEGFNAVLAGEWEMLDPRWNVIFQFYAPEHYEKDNTGKGSSLSREEVVEDPYIIHFTSKQYKPWHPDCKHPERDRFHRYLRESQWFSPREYLQWRARFLWARAKFRWGVAKNISRPYRHAVREWVRSGLKVIGGRG